MKSKARCLFVGVFLLAGAVPTRAAQSGDFEYTSNGTSITIDRYTGLDGAVIIPDLIAGLPVTSIGASISMGGSGPGAFQDCTNLTGVSIPGSVTTIGRWAFYDCCNLTNVTLPPHVTSIGDGAFHGCSSLTSITIPGSAISIGSGAFEGCSRLNSVTIPSSITKIDSYVFCGCSSLMSLAIPDSVTEIGYRAFTGCSGLTNVTIPNSVTNLGGEAFSACSNLTSVMIGTGLRYGGGSDCFADCIHLAGITVDPLNPAYSSLQGVLFDKSQTALFACPAGKAGSYAIPSSVRAISDGAFKGCRCLTGVNIPEGVTYIGYGAFVGCTGLSSLTIPRSVTHIGGAVFAGCTSLSALAVDPFNSSYTDVDGVLFDKNLATLIQCPGGRSGSYAVPNSVTRIEEAAFSSCISLTSVTIPNSVISIGDDAFHQCSSLSVITVDPLNPAYSSLQGVLFDKSQTALLVCPGARAGSYTLPSSVHNIEGSAFSGCSRLTSVAIPDGVIVIGSYAFSGCTGLTNVTMGSGLASIGDFAFEDCSNLAGVYFKGNAPWPSFSGCAALATMYYLPGTTGWGTTFAGRPTAPWVLPYPVVLTTAPNFGIQTNAFGFRISWATNASVVVEAATSPSGQDWSPVATNALVEGWSDFRDPQWTNYPARFYRLRSP